MGILGLGFRVYPYSGNLVFVKELNFSYYFGEAMSITIHIYTPIMVNLSSVTSTQADGCCLRGRANACAAVDDRQDGFAFGI